MSESEKVGKVESEDHAQGSFLNVIKWAFLGTATTLVFLFVMGMATYETQGHIFGLLVPYHEQYLKEASVKIVELDGGGQLVHISVTLFQEINGDTTGFVTARCRGEPGDGAGQPYQLKDCVPDDEP